MQRKAAASARLCVETNLYYQKKHKIFAAASARLCVETINNLLRITFNICSRLRAAVC